MNKEGGTYEKDHHRDTGSCGCGQDHAVGGDTVSDRDHTQAGPGRPQGCIFDTDSQERDRGITIFSKQAEIEYEDTRITLLDTPGHADFSAEMERTLQVLDHAILVISGKDGVQGHTLTLWRLLEKYGIPVSIFVNKMDLQGTDKAAVMEELKRRLDDRCTDFTDDLPDGEELASCHEQLLEEYFDTGEISRDSLVAAIADRQVFPCWFGSALKNDGIRDFPDGILQVCFGA